MSSNGTQVRAIMAHMMPLLRLGVEDFTIAQQHEPESTLLRYGRREGAQCLQQGRNC